MAETPIQTTRSDVDIEADIHHLMMTYPPLSHDRHRVEVNVEDGAVTVSGYVKAPQTERYLLNAIALVDGVRSVTAQQFYNDETLRLDVGQVVPMGVFVNVEYGAVILSGTLPADVNVEQLAQSVGMVAGVHRVITAFR